MPRRDGAENLTGAAPSDEIGSPTYNSPDLPADQAFDMDDNGPPFDRDTMEPSSGLAGGRIKVVGFPGCLVVSLVLSIVLTMILNLLL